MPGKTSRTASGANLIDLHSVRAGLAGADAALDQAEGLRRQKAGRLASGAEGQISVGDKVVHPSTREIGVVVRICAGDAVVQFLGRREVIEGATHTLRSYEPEDDGLPCDCEPADCEAAS